MGGSRIIVPTVARKSTLESIHEGYQGEVKRVLKAKEGVCWPGMYKKSATWYKDAIQEHPNAQLKCPMIAVDVPPHAWHTLGADHFKGAKVNGFDYQ